MSADTLIAGATLVFAFSFTFGYLVGRSHGEEDIDLR